MKTVTRSIQLPAELDLFAQSEMRAGAYSSLSEYFRQMLRQRREAQIEADVKLLGKAIRTAPEENEPVDVVVETTRKVRQQMRREGWKPGQ